ncbi:zf-TFIIB domain-containing protein [Hydrogenophaga sp.]|uniref:TFIIB-type zinc ribbon-containing protein n=1 Tax=Hydrogenophaga sp. TaxID=1904254 RepID=UPI003F6EA184
MCWRVQKAVSAKPPNIALEPIMKCPTCDSSSLVITERSGIEIDYCTQCRGVWLDRGELEKLLKRAATMQARQRQFVDLDEPDPKKRTSNRRKSWLVDIFE